MALKAYGGVGLSHMVEHAEAVMNSHANEGDIYHA
jgi:hypothetical protein